MEQTTETADRKSILSKKGIVTLRNYAMDIGVKVPSKLKKGELIDEIILVESGQKQPYLKKKEGRRRVEGTVSAITPAAGKLPETIKNVRNKLQEITELLNGLVSDE